MKWLKQLSISLAIAFFAVCCGAVLLFNWSAFGYKALTVPTGSMRPHIPPGSVVLMHRVPYSTLRVGDVITYTNPLNAKATVTHRIIKINSSGVVPIYITKGDANPSADPIKVIAGQVQGKAIWHAPHIGTALSWSKTWVGIAILVYLPAAVIMWGSALDMADYMRKFQLYELKLFRKTRKRLALGRRAGAATVLSALFILILGAAAGPVSALLRSNTVSLKPNTLVVRTVTPPPPPPPVCTTGSNSTTVNITNNGSSSSSTNSTTINNSNNQTATTGNATNSGNTTGGNATSGNATNTNCTSITVTNTNH